MSLQDVYPVGRQPELGTSNCSQIELAIQNPFPILWRLRPDSYQPAGVVLDQIEWGGRLRGIGEIDL